MSNPQAPGAAAPRTVLDPAHADYGNLTRAVGKDEVRAFRLATKAAQRANPGIATGLESTTSIGAIIAIVVFGALFLFVFIDMVQGGAFSSGRSTGVLVFVAIIVIVGVGVFLHTRGIGGTWAKWLRLTGFARANGLQYLSREDEPNFPGAIFQVGRSQAAYDYFKTISGRAIDFGNYRYTTGSGKSSTTHHWGFLALQLDRRLPNMVLDSKANNGLFGGSNLPETFNRDQVLHLEGDFDKYFTLYCPNEYEQDALYVFTPDLMALLIDDAAPFDVEIVDDWMFVYSARPFDELNADTYRRLFRIVATVGAKAVTQTQRYHDDRVALPGADIVAPQGQRLRHGFSLSTLIVVAVVGGIWIYNVISGH